MMHLKNMTHLRIYNDEVPFMFRYFKWFGRSRNWNKWLCRSSSKKVIKLNGQNSKYVWKHSFSTTLNLRKQMIVNSPKKWTKVTLNSKNYLVVILRYFKLHIEETRKNVTTIKRQNHDTVSSGNSLSRNSGISCYSGYIQLTDCLF